VAFAIEGVQPPLSKIVPIIGVPGFRPEYPFHTYLGNRTILSKGGVWKRARYATANCPFSAFYKLEEIAADYPGHLMKVAPIGTRPHALGAVLFALSRDRDVELVYDYPIPNPNRTAGVGTILVYEISALGLRGGAS
jgi:hypothetical protein